MAFTKKLLNFQNVVAGATAFLNPERGPSYRRIVLALGGTTFTKAMINRLLLKLNGTIIYDLTGSQLDSINKYRGIADDANHLTLDFVEPQEVMANLAGMNAGAIPTGPGCTSFSLEVEIDGTAVAPTLQAYAVLGAPAALTKDSQFLCMIPQASSFDATGKFPIVIPSGNGKKSFLKRAHFFGGSISELTVKKGSAAIFDQVPTTVAQFIQKEHGRAIQAGLYSYDPVVNGDLMQMVALGSAHQMSFDVTVGAAEVVTTVSELLAGLADL